LARGRVVLGSRRAVFSGIRVAVGVRNGWPGGGGWLARVSLELGLVRVS